VAAHKTVGPIIILTYLGILIDPHAFELRFPADKQFALWYGPLIILTVLNVLAIIRIAYILCKRAWKYNRELRDPSLPNQNHRAALKEVLPVITYPVIFHATSLLSLAN